MYRYYIYDILSLSVCKHYKLINHKTLKPKIYTNKKMWLTCSPKYPTHSIIINDYSIIA